MAEIWHTICQKQALFTSFRDLTEIFLILFFDRFWRFKKCFRLIFSRSLRKSDRKNMYHRYKSLFFCLTLFTWWPEMTSSYIMVTKHRKWCLQMSETLCMQIRWLCLSLTSKFRSPMSPSPKSRTFWLWPDLWHHWWPQVIKICFPSTIFPGISNAAWIFRIGAVVSKKVVFEVDLSMSKYARFDSSRRDKRVGTTIMSVTFKILKLFVKNYFAQNSFFDFWWPVEATRLTLGQIWRHDHDEEFNSLSNAVFGFVLSIIVPELMEVFRSDIRHSRKKLENFANICPWRQQFWP